MLTQTRQPEQTRTSAAHRGPPRRAFGSTALVTIALAVGTWLGLTAPSVSPVAPPVPVVATMAPTNPAIAVQVGGVP